jgi:hypothetical protein
MTHALCNSCRNLVPAEPVEREGKVYLAKKCRKCGPTETLISADARRYWKKRSIDTPFEHKVCALNCLNCDHRATPGLVFIDITNRCNMNCRICLNNTPGMGFLFHPPMEYFERIFQHLTTLKPRPAVQLFGGEPTMREDLFDIIDLAKSYGLRPRVVTNGLRLADPDYCRRLTATKVKILLSYDGDNPQLYADLRGTPKAMELKRQALDNIQKTGAGRVVLMTLLAKDYNAAQLPELIQFCHERRDYIGAIYLMPLAHMWKPERWDYNPEQMTMEDVEMIVNEAFHDDLVEFIPAGFQGYLPTLMRCLGIKALPFMGGHPNCESLFLMFSDGQQFVPFTRYLKMAPNDALRALQGTEQKLARRVKWLNALGIGRKKTERKSRLLFMLGAFTALFGARRFVKLGQLVKGKGFGKTYHLAAFALQLILGRRIQGLLERHMNVHGILQILVLPFEDPSNIETDRMERCPGVFAYVDPEDDKVRIVPLCAWTSLHKRAMMRKIAEKQGTATPATATPVNATPAAEPEKLVKAGADS